MSSWALVYQGVASVGLGIRVRFAEGSLQLGDTEVILKQGSGASVECPKSEYQRARQAESAAGATINKEIACISSILSDQGGWERIRRDVKRLPENEEAGLALEPAEERMLLEQASDSGEHQGKWTPLSTVTVLGLSTGMRHKEIRTLRWKDVNFENRVLRVAESKTRAGDGRPIPLTQPAWAVLNYWAERFPGRRSEHSVFRACENGQVDPTRGIAS